MYSLACPALVPLQAEKSLVSRFVVKGHSEQNTLDSYKLHASGYVKKSVTLDGFEQVIRELEEYWFVICKRVSQNQLSCTRN